MRDVAAIAGVSVSTVSRVVNGNPVAADMARKVQEAVALVGYRHNHTAGSAAPRRWRVADHRLDRRGRRQSLLFRCSSRRRGHGSRARRRDVRRQLGRATRARARVDRRTAGAPSRWPGHRADRHRPNSSSDETLPPALALVFVDRPPLSIDADCVLSDNRGAAERAVTHLILHGHRRIGFLGDRPGVHTASERLAGYRVALARAGIAKTRSLRHPRHRAMDAYELTSELMRSSDAPTALFTSQNLITVEALRALHHLGHRDEVALVGFDDVSLADAIEPAVTVSPKARATSAATPRSCCSHALTAMTAQRAACSRRPADHTRNRRTATPRMTHTRPTGPLRTANRKPAEAIAATSAGSHPPRSAPPTQR